MRNVEIKVRVTDLPRLAAVLRDELAAQDAGTLEQRDVFLPCRSGRLKMRFENDRQPVLILYHRDDAARLRTSDYELYPVENGEAFLALARRAWGMHAQVRKTRQLFLIDNVRVHLDHVEALGEFVEIEAKVDDEHDESSCFEQARRILQALGLESRVPESRAYVDMLAGDAPG